MQQVPRQQHTSPNPIGHQNPVTYSTNGNNDFNEHTLSPQHTFENQVEQNAANGGDNQAALIDVFDGLQGPSGQGVDVEDGASIAMGGASEDSFSAQARPTFGNQASGDAQNGFASHSRQQSRNPSNNSSRIHHVQIDTNANEANSDGTTQSPRQEEIKEDEVTQMMTGQHRQLTVQQNPLIHQNASSQAINGTYNRVQAVINEIQQDLNQGRAIADL